MTLDTVVSRLFDGIDTFPEQVDTAKRELERLRKRRHWTIKQLDDWCWKDSALAFDYIFG